MPQTAVVSLSRVDDDGAPGSASHRSVAYFPLQETLNRLSYMNSASHTSGTTALAIRTITREQYAGFLSGHPTASFLQNSRWAQVKAGWQGELLGAFEGDQLVATAGVLCRSLPVMRGKFLAYIPEGPVFDPQQVAIESLLQRLKKHLKRRGAFLLRVGLPGITHRWAAQDVRHGLLKGEETLMEQLEALERDTQAADLETRLKALGGVPPSDSEEFEAGQPRYQARVPLKDSTMEDVLGRMDQTSRRQTKKSLRSELEITVASAEDLPAWQRLYEETAERDGFTPRPLPYFQGMYEQLNAADDTDCVLYFASCEDTILASAIYVRQGEFAWYLYGASSSQERKRYAPRALQHQQIEHALAAGCQWYDLGGVSPSLNAENHLAGLTRFKTTMGADVVKTLGEWDFPINRALSKAFDYYMSRR